MKYFKIIKNENGQEMLDYDDENYLYTPQDIRYSDLFSNAKEENIFIKEFIYVVKRLKCRCYIRYLEEGYGEDGVIVEAYAEDSNNEMATVEMTIVEVNSHFIDEILKSGINVDYDILENFYKIIRGLSNETKLKLELE